GTLDIVRKGRAIRINKNRTKPFTAMGQVKTSIPDFGPDLIDDLSTDDAIIKDDDPCVSDFQPSSTQITNSDTPTSSSPVLSNSDNYQQTAPPKKRGRPRKDANI
ncbi:hypothetical protein, partial [Salmonella enterica]|uniref:hypothetical protein n=1 Tax=Salmonella enterica TaxID=28901 RepID=UPI003526533C